MLPSRSQAPRQPRVERVAHTIAQQIHGKHGQRKTNPRKQNQVAGDLKQALTDRKVILVDDGLATGSTMAAAVRAVRQSDPERVIVAVPVAPPETIVALRQEADEVITVLAPSGFGGVGVWYEDFSQTTDQEVIGLLERTRQVSGSA